MEIIAGVFMNIFTFLIMTIFIAVTVIILAVILRRIFIKQSFKKAIIKHSNGKTHVVLAIKIPPHNERGEDAMENLLRSLHRLLPTGTRLSLEMVSENQFLHFYIAVSKEQKNTIESQLYAEYPDAEIEQVPDSSEGIEGAVFAEIGFKHPSIYAIKTYQELDEDLLKNLSSILSKTESGEKVFFQLVLKRVGSGFTERGLGAFLTKQLNKSAVENSKLSQDLYVGKLRLAYKAENKAIATQKLNTLISLLKSTKSAQNELKSKKSADLHMEWVARVFEQGDFWTVPEIVALYHFPYKGGLVSNVVQSDSKRSPAPDILPREDLSNPKEISIFGETNYRNEKRRFGIKRIDRRRHMYVVGKTGSGKSRLLELLLLADIQNGEGCCLLDPHGDLAAELLAYIPKERIKDVVYVNPSDRDFPIAFNPLESVQDYEVRQHLSTFFIAIFKKLFAQNWNSRMEHIIRYVTLALLETPDSNILGIQRMLTDISFRQRVIKQIQDPVVKSFWVNEFSAWNERYANEAIVPLLNKVGQFIANPIVRNMIGQRKNSLDFEEFMNEGKIVIINISKGKLGDENAALLGSMFITKIQQAALARSKMKEEERRDFYFYVDEFQNFATDAFISILSEARKYHLDLTIAHQYIAQLPEDIKSTAFGNVGTVVVFAVGGEDAKYLASEFAPVFSAEDMINLNTREMYLKMSIDGKITPPFSASTITVPRPTVDYSVEIVENSRVKYGKNRVAVENEIKKWSQSQNGYEETEEVSDFPEPIV